MRKILLAMSAFALVLTSCEKEKDESEVTVENIAGPYKLLSMKVQMGSGPEVDMMSQIDQCNLDDVQTFNTNGTYTYTDAGTQCSPPDNDSGTWSLPSTTSIVIDGETMTIKSFDGDKLELTDTYTDQGITYTTTIVMDKQ